MVLINAIFALFSLLWLVGQIAQAESDPEFWFALAFTLLCAANVVSMSGRGTRQKTLGGGRQTSADPGKLAGTTILDDPDLEPRRSDIEAPETNVAALDQEYLRRMEELESDLGVVLVAFEPGYHPAELSDAQVARLRRVEDELGLILLALTPIQMNP